MKKYKYLFGPVSSRRLGQSLGVDLVPFKTCSLNCVYCECGLTTNLTAKQAEYVPTKDVLAELDDLLSTNPNLDFITFSGNGEPTLHNGFLEIAAYIKSNYPQYKVCLITNSTLMADESFTARLLNNGHSCIDVIMPSLDAITQDVYEKIDQPEATVKANEVTAALEHFSQQFDGKIWLEIFILPGVNDTDDELQQFEKVLKNMRVDKVLLNCLDRPAPYDWVKAATSEQMQRVKLFFTSCGIESEIIGKVTTAVANEIVADPKATIIELISRRPSTVEDLIQATGKTAPEVKSILDELAIDHALEVTTEARGNFYRLIKKNQNDKN